MGYHNQTFTKTTLICYNSKACHVRDDARIFWAYNSKTGAYGRP